MYYTVYYIITTVYYKWQYKAGVHKKTTGPTYSSNGPTGGRWYPGQYALATSANVNPNHRLNIVFVYATRITLVVLHSYLLAGEDQPICAACDAPLTVKHILLDCPALRDIRQKYFAASSLKDIFESVDNQNIIDFIKNAHFYHQL